MRTIIYRLLFVIIFIILLLFFRRRHLLIITFIFWLILTLLLFRVFISFCILFSLRFFRPVWAIRIIISPCLGIILVIGVRLDLLSFMFTFLFSFFYFSSFFFYPSSFFLLFYFLPPFLLLQSQSLLLDLPLVLKGLLLLSLLLLDKHFSLDSFPLSLLFHSLRVSVGYSLPCGYRVFTDD